ncbi:LysM peptidoglycan-binding domain-containing protein [Spirochaetota bacterium]
MKQIDKNIIMNKRYCLMKLIAVLCIGATLLFPSLDLLIFDASPYSISIGKGFDLLDTKTPITRTYSGVFALKDKSEIEFFHSILPNNIAIENALVGFRNDAIKGIKFGAYVAYSDIGGFENKDYVGNPIETLNANDILIGLPIMFNVKTLNLSTSSLMKVMDMDSQKVKKSGKLVLNEILKSINTGVNLNYFQSTMGGYSASTFFADFNMSAKFKVGYIGLPEPLITMDDVEDEKISLITKNSNETAKKIESLQKAKNMTPEDISEKETEYEKEKSDFAADTTKIYDKKKADIGKVYDARAEIYKLYNNPNVEVQPTDISNFLNNAKTETKNLTDIARNAVNQNYEYLQSTIRDDLKINQTDIVNYKDKFKKYSENETAYNSVSELFKLYLEYINTTYRDKRSEDKYDLQSTKSQRRGFVEYTVVSGDTLASIASRFYQDEMHAGTIGKYNKIKDTEAVLEAGEILKIPVLTNEQKERETEFVQKKALLLKELKAYKMNQAEKLYYESMMSKMESRVALYVYKSDVEAETDEKYRILNNNLTKQNKKFDATMEDLVKDIKKLKLKKQLDILNASNDKKVREAAKDYKGDEQLLFKNMLLEIFRAKKLMIQQFKAEEKKKVAYRLNNIKEIYRKKHDSLTENNIIAKIEAGADKEKIKSINQEHADKVKTVNVDMGKEITVANNGYTQKIDEYDWEIYTTQLIYRSSDDKLNTLAIGTSVKNIGMPITFDQKAEQLPMAIGADLNYQYLNIEDHCSILYFHFGQSEFENITLGGGVMYRLFDIFEIRSGTYFENGQLVLGGGLAMIFDVGLMNYRFDSGFKYEANYGLVYNLGINVIF